jgi:hypothetical protein
MFDLHHVFRHTDPREELLGILRLERHVANMIRYSGHAGEPNMEAQAAAVAAEYFMLPRRGPSQPSPPCGSCKTGSPTDSLLVRTHKMPLFLDTAHADDRFSAAVFTPNGTVLDSWDLRTREKIPMRPMPPDIPKKYNSSLRQMPGDRIELSLELSVLIVFYNGLIAGAVNVYFNELDREPQTVVFRMMNISTTGIIGRAAILIVGAAQQLVETWPQFYPLVAPIAPYFSMECILLSIGAVTIYGRVLSALDDPEADPNAKGEKNLAIFAGTPIVWVSYPYRRTDIIKNNLFNEMNTFVAANAWHPSFDFNERRPVRAAENVRH